MQVQVDFFALFGGLLDWFIGALYWIWGFLMWPFLWEGPFDFFAWFGGLWNWVLGIFLWFWGIVNWLIFWVVDFVNWIWFLISLPENFMFLFRAIVFPGLIFILMALIFTVWYTRKIWARLQDRRGPMHMGKYGGLQLFADAIKLMSKEIIIPDKAKRWMYRILPSLLLVIVLLPFAFIPWDPYWNILGSPTSPFPDLSVSLVLVFAILTAVPVLSLLIGWVSGSKYSLIGGFRAANNQFAAEIPMVISSVGPAMLAGSLSLYSIVMAQTNIWYIVLLPINFITFFVAAIASVGTFPFDAPVADSEIIFGWRTELSGIYFTVVYFAEFGITDVKGVMAEITAALPSTQRATVTILSKQQALKSGSIAHSIHLKVQELSGVLSIFGVIPRTNFLAVRPMLAKGFLDYELIPIV